jgi:hypothetical protein
MERFFIEVPHESKKSECAKAIKILLETGSHFLTNTEWGCFDGEHKGWVTVEADSKEEARYILPPAYRSKAKIVRLNKFTLKEINEIIDHHDD